MVSVSSTRRTCEGSGPYCNSVETAAAPGRALSVGLDARDPSSRYHDEWLIDELELVLFECGPQGLGQLVADRSLRSRVPLAS